MTPLQSWTSTVAFWSTVAQAPSRVARAQTAATLRMMRTASHWTAARRVGPATVAEAAAPTPVEAAARIVPEAVEASAPVEAAVEVLAPGMGTGREAVAEAAEAEAQDPLEHVPHEALVHASPSAIAAATAEAVEALLEEEPDTVPVPPAEPEAPALAVLAEPAPEEALVPQPLLAMTEEGGSADAAAPALVEAAEAAVAEAPASTRPVRARPAAGGARTRKPRRG